MRYTSESKTLFTHAHARKGPSCNRNGKSLNGDSRAAEVLCERIPHVCARACYVTGQAVSLTDLPGLFCVPSLHPHQIEAVVATASGRDVLLTSPTGSGKSLAYWGAGLRRLGLTLVVSPLRSLIADQYRRLRELEIPVRIWNSDVRDDYKAETVKLLESGWRGFLYTTPESLKGKALSEAVTDRVNLAVVDEAHCCLRERGFRVCYAWLGGLLDTIAPAVRLACTATLPTRDREYLIQSLHLEDPVEITLPVARSNLQISVIEHSEYTLAGILNQHNGEAGIIFCATVRCAEKLHARLESQGRSVTLYHGRLSAKDKKQAQAEFMSGERPVAVVTDAFLLGIDKADLRFVAHYDHPKSIEDWVQGFGRAGRDGLPAWVYGCFRGSAEGRESRCFLIDSTFPPTEDLQMVWEYLLSAPGRSETQTAIGEKVLGKRGKYSGPAILTTLQRHGLVVADPCTEDLRKRICRARGDFDRTDWSRYRAECAETCNRFDQLCELVELPDDAIPGEIARYFEPVKEPRPIEPEADENEVLRWSA